MPSTLDLVNVVVVKAGHAYDLVWPFFNLSGGPPPPPPPPWVSQERPFTQSCDGLEQLNACRSGIASANRTLHPKVFSCNVKWEHCTNCC